MTVFDVYVNERKLCRAGVGREGVLDAIVSWVRLSGPAATTARRLKRPVEETRLHVGGLREDTHRAWSDRNLEVGDRVSIVVGRAKTCDPPAREERRDLERMERLERSHYRRLKRRFEDPRSSSLVPTSADEDTTSFLNVDLDVWSRSPLDALVEAFGKRVSVLHVGKEGRDYGAHLELAVDSDSPDRLLRGFVRQVQRLPRTGKLLWNRARAREFNVGIQGGARPYSFEFRLERETLLAVASVNARIGMTVYAAQSIPDRGRGATQSQGG